MDKRKQNQIQTNFLSHSQPRTAIISTQLSGLQSPNPTITPNNVFNYEQQNFNKIQGTISGVYELQPQYSMYSPFRSSEGRKDFHGQVVSQNVRGRRLNGKDVDVICSIGSQDSSRIKILNQGTHADNEQHSNNPSRDAFGSNLININVNGYQSLPTGFAGDLIHAARERSNDQRKDQGSTFNKRKNSTESRKSRDQKSQGRSDNKKRGKSSSNSQSRAAVSSDKKITGINTQISGKATQNRLQRPNSAKNLKSQASVANIHQTQKTMITSPTLTVLQREPSQQFLPPKPRPQRNQTFAKLPEVLYQSVGSHPLASQFQHSSNSSSQKRVPSASSERKSQLVSSKPIAASVQQEKEAMTFSPTRGKKMQTQQSSNQKLQTSGGKIRSSKQKKLSNQKKSGSKQRRTNNIMVADVQNLQNLSPNIGRVRPDQVINEENKEESWDQSNRYQPSYPMHSFDAREVKSRPNHQAEVLESVDSSLSLKLQIKEQRAKNFNDNILKTDIFKTIKQQIQNVNLNEEERKKRRHNEKKEKIPVSKIPNENQKVARQLNVDQMKLLMNKKLEGTTKNIAKKKLQVQQVFQQKEEEILKQKKLESREQWQKEREERHECIEMVKESMKQVMQSQSTTSLTKKRGTSKSQQRPFSAKNPDMNQQLLIKVPPVQSDIQSNVYDPVFLQTMPKTETSPLQEQRYDHNNIIKGSTLSGTVSDQHLLLKAAELQYHNPMIGNYVKKQRQERSKKRKLDEFQEYKSQMKKEQAMKMLQEQYKKNFESFKHNIVQQTKTKLKKTRKSYKNLETQEQHLKRVRSKSKKRPDEEKENRRQSLSPQKQQQLSRSGTKSRSDRKRKQQKIKLTQTVSYAELQQMQRNVKDILAQNDEQQNSVKNFPNLMKKQQYLKSNTVQDLHANINTVGPNQIRMSKGQLRELMQRKMSQHNSQIPSVHDDNSSQNDGNQHVNVNRNQQQQQQMSLKIQTNKTKSGNNLQLTSQPGQNPINRPQSAQVQKNNIIEMIQQQQQLQKGQQQRLLEQKTKASITIQKYFRAFISKKIVNKLRAEKHQIEQNLKQVKEKFLNNKETRPQQYPQFSPIKQIIKEQQPQMKLEANIQILDVDSKLKGSHSSNTSSDNHQNSSKLSRSEANLKQLIQQEIENNNKKKQSRPNSSETYKLAQIQNKTSESDSFRLHKNIKNVADNIDKQISLNKRHHADINKIKGQIIDYSSSNQESSCQTFERVNLPDKPRQIIHVKKQTATNKSPNKNQGPRNLQNQFDSLSSSNKLSKDIDPREESKDKKLDEESKKDSFLVNVMNEQYNRQQKSFISAKKEDNQLQNSQIQDLQNSQILRSEAGENPWRFNRRSFQDFFNINNNSQILNEEGKRMQGSSSKSKFYKEINQYEDYLDVMEKKVEKDKKKLRKLQDKKHLSPASQKRKDTLEKWVTKQEESINLKKNWFHENVNEIISKIQKDLKETKKKIGSGRKPGRNNASMEYSFEDFSIAQFNSSSIHSTPRTLQNHLSASSGSQTQNNQLVELQNQQNDYNNKKQNNLFEYKIQKEKSQTSQAQPDTFIQKINKQGQEKHKSDLIYNTEPKVATQEHSIIVEQQVSVLQDMGVNDFSKTLSPHNVFAQNMADQEDSVYRKTQSLGNQQSDIDSRQRDSEIFNSSRVEDDEGESLSKQEPPQFQSPTLSEFSPNQIMKEEDYNDDEDKQAPLHPSKFASNFDSQMSEIKGRELQIIPVSPDNILYSDVGNEQLNYQRLEQENKQKLNDEQDRLYADAFKDIKEPELPISFDQANKMREEKQEIDAQTDILTDFILGLLMEQLQHNMYPKRPIFPKSPSHSKDTEITIDPDHDHDIIEEISPASSEHNQEELTIALKPTDTEIEAALKKKKLRGIKTTMRIVDSYSQQIFKSIHWKFFFTYRMFMLTRKWKMP